MLIGWRCWRNGWWAWHGPFCDVSGCHFCVESEDGRACEVRDTHTPRKILIPNYNDVDFSLSWFYSSFLPPPLPPHFRLSVSTTHYFLSSSDAGTILGISVTQMHKWRKHSCREWSLPSWTSSRSKHLCVVYSRDYFIVRSFPFFRQFFGANLPPINPNPLNFFM